MTTRTPLITIGATALALATAPAALAHTDTVGSANGTANANVCVADIACTYVNYSHGKPTDVARHTGTIKRWTVNAASVGGTVRLRVLRRASGGRFKFIRSSGLRTIGQDGKNTFKTSLRVKKGDVLALSNSTSGLYMTSAPAWREIRYFNYSDPQADGQTSATSRTVPQLRLLLSAKVSR